MTLTTDAPDIGNVPSVRQAEDSGAPPSPTPPHPSRRRWQPPWRNPWRRPWILEGFTWLYLIWSIVPIGIAVLFSFNNGKSQSVWQGFSTRWYWGDPINSVWHNPALAGRGVPDHPPLDPHHHRRRTPRRGLRHRHQPLAHPDLHHASTS